MTTTGTSSPIGVLALPNRPWEERMMTAAQLLTRLSGDYRVVWMSPAHHWRQARERRADPTPVFRPLDGRHDFTVYTAPAWLPHTYRPPSVGRWLRARRLRQARRHLVRQGCERIVLYVWRPRYVDALDLVPHDVSVYHIVDEYSFSSDDPPTPPDEQRLIDSVDRLVVHSPGLVEKKGRPDAALIPNGVDYRAFAEPRDEPEDLAPVPRPRMGYTGYLKRQLDWDLLEALCDRHPDYSWVFVGAVLHEDLGARIRALGARNNVHLLGSKTSGELARYPQHFDVCLMPYVNDRYTRYIFPLKLYEYLASGRPAVGTPIRSLLDFAGVLELAEGPGEWSAALSRSLERPATSPERRDERRDLARRHDWRLLAGRIEELVESALS